MYDKVPAAVSAVVLGALPVVPGPSKAEWAATLGGLLALGVRELVWWLRNRRKRKG